MHQRTSFQGCETRLCSRNPLTMILWGHFSLGIEENKERNGNMYCVCFSCHVYHRNGRMWKVIRGGREERDSGRGKKGSERARMGKRERKGEKTEQLYRKTGLYSSFKTSLSCRIYPPRKKVKQILTMLSHHSAKVNFLALSSA